MENVLKQAKITASQHWTGGAAEEPDYAQVYELSRHRIYALAYWMTRNEVQADQLTSTVFQRAFTASRRLDDELMDKILVSEIRELTPVGALTLEPTMSQAAAAIRGNVKKTQLEDAVWQLPATERIIFLLHDVEGYEHGRIARTLNLTEAESQLGLHAARLRLRGLLASAM